MQDFKSYLKELGLCECCVDVKQQAELFLSEMERGLAGEESSLMMLPTYLSCDGELLKNTSTAVLDAGGTNLRAARVRFGENGEAVVEKLQKSFMPGTRGEVDAEEMFDSFAEAIIPMLSQNGLLTVCFSYAFKSLSNGDAEILEFGKEVNVNGAVGMRVGEQLTAAIRRAGYNGSLNIKVINDTAAVLYSAVATGSSNAVGFILGTGTNTAYLENTADIKTAEPFKPSKMLINMESGGYALGPQGTVDKKLDEESLIPGYHLHEKMCSGAYLGEIILRGAKSAADEGYFSDEFLKNIVNCGKITMPQIESFLNGEAGELSALCGDDRDSAKMRELVLAVLRRAGRLTAANIAAVIERVRRGGASGEVVIAENGTTFKRSEPLRAECMLQLKKLPLGDYRFIQTEDDTLIGSAAASLLG